jgi:hypothetical protein
MIFFLKKKKEKREKWLGWQPPLGYRSGLATGPPLIAGLEVAEWVFYATSYLFIYLVLLL